MHDAVSRVYARRPVPRCKRLNFRDDAWRLRPKQRRENGTQRRRSSRQGNACARSTASKRCRFETSPPRWASAFRSSTITTDRGAICSGRSASTASAKSGASISRCSRRWRLSRAPAVADIIRAVLQPVNQWRKPGRESSLQFYALALVCPLPEVKDMLDAGVAGFHRPVALLQRALPHLTHEEICWRLYFTLKLSHQTAWDAARLTLLSNGSCNGSDPDEALERAIAFGGGRLSAPPFRSPKKAAARGKKRAQRQPK